MCIYIYNIYVHTHAYIHVYILPCDWLNESVSIYMYTHILAIILHLFSCKWVNLLYSLDIETLQSIYFLKTPLEINWFLLKAERNWEQILF